MKRFVISITKTARHRNEKRFYTYALEEKVFHTEADALAWLKKEYQCKRYPMYVDTADGSVKKVGYIYGFKFSPSSHGETSGFEQHWVTIWD
jgi:hypothetical protein